MSKTSIKVIRRKDAEEMAKAKTQSAFEAKQTASVNEEKGERFLHREIGGTVSNWISERRENNRLERITAIDKFFVNESLLSDI